MDTEILNYMNSFAGRWAVLDIAVIFKAEYLGWWMLAGLGLFLIFSVHPGHATSGIRTLHVRGVWEKAKEMVFTALVSGVLSRFVITELIRFFYSRPRPFDLPAEALAKAGVDGIYQLIPHVSGGSFPSGHASFFFAIATAVFIYYKKWGILFYLFAFAIGISRVIAGIHWPSDILGGAVIGVASAYFVNYFVSKYKNRLIA